MYTCPVCGKRGIRIVAKWWAWPAAPARCRSCGEYFAANAGHSQALIIVAALATTLLGFLSVYLHSGIPLSLGVFASLAAFLRLWHRQPLSKLTPKQVALARAAEGISWAATIALFFQ